MSYASDSYQCPVCGRVQNGRTYCHCESESNDESNVVESTYTHLTTPPEINNNQSNRSKESGLIKKLIKNFFG